MGIYRRRAAWRLCQKIPNEADPPRMEAAAHGQLPLVHARRMSGNVTGSARFFAVRRVGEDIQKTGFS